MTPRLQIVNVTLCLCQYDNKCNVDVTARVVTDVTTNTMMNAGTSPCGNRRPWCHPAAGRWSMYCRSDGPTAEKAGSWDHAEKEGVNIHIHIIQELCMIPELEFFRYRILDKIIFHSQRKPVYVPLPNGWIFRSEGWRIWMSFEFWWRA